MNNETNSTERKLSFGEEKRSMLDMIIFNLRMHKVLPYIPKNIETIADFGCGFKADTLRYLIDNKYATQGVGIDLSITEEVFPNIELLTANFDVDVTPVSPESIDCAVSLALLEHVNNPKKYLADIFSSLKKGGVLLLTTPAPSSKWLLEFLAFKLHIIDKAEIQDHKHYFSSQELLALAKEIGFTTYTTSSFEFGMNNCLCAKK